MKKIYMLSLVAVLLFSCQKNNVPAEERTAEITQRNCATMDVLNAQIAKDPSIEQRMNAIETFTQNAIARGDISCLNAMTITIPVVVHVIYNTPKENISDAQIQSQIDVLNEDYNLRNRDRNSVPALFDPLKADIGVKFVLAQQPIRKYSTTSRGANYAVKFSNRGGDDAVGPTHNLNMLVCNLGQNLLGYSTFLGQSNPSSDGVVILYSSFGSRDKYRQGTYINKYDLGRTASHEVVHWMNLRHIWGDRTCGTDYVDDTPVAETAKFNCPSFPKISNCGTDRHAEMTMNYMDYTQDACMYMFTNGQKSCMLTVFAPGGQKLLSSNKTFGRMISVLNFATQC